MKNKESLTAYFPLILLCLLMVPLLFININNYHDWGDDFAQYILQAQWMAGSLNEIPVTDVSGYSPGIKGILFSVLLIPSTFITSQTCKT